MRKEVEECSGLVGTSMSYSAEVSTLGELKEVFKACETVEV